GIADISDAVVVPPVEARFKQRTGVLTAEGAYVPLAETRRHGATLTLAPPMPDELRARLSGTWLWGGTLYDHFGHFLIESQARLWQIHACGIPCQGIVFVPKRPRRTGGARHFQADVLAAWGIDAEVQLATRPTSVERLIVTPQGIGLGARIAGTPEMRRTAWDHFGIGIAPDGPDRLYVSRSRLAPEHGAILLEPEIEAALAVDGYTAFHPQDHDIPTQIARYKAARQIIICDGSPAHLFAYLARPSQQVGYLPRRRIWHDGPVDHIAAFARRRPRLLPMPAREWLPRVPKTFRNVFYSMHDMAELGAALAAAEMIETLSAWADPDPERVERRIAEIVPAAHFAEA
ncbi:MAG: glycosyltransferase 61 family protein, partial [Pseudomonadota bacterium]